MRYFSVLGIMVFGVAAACCRADLVALDDSNMAGVTGGTNGIVFDIAMQINTDSSGVPLQALSTSASPTNDCTNETTGCKAVLALQFENRPGSWLMLKDYYGMLSMSNLQLDGNFNPTTNTVNTLNAAGGGTGSPFNMNRFVSAPYQATQACISDIASCNPAGMGSFMFSFPGTSANYGDIGLYLNIGRMAVEFDSGGAVCATVNTAACGYNQDARGSFAGLVVSDTTQAKAQISINGQLRVYGF